MLNNFTCTKVCDCMLTNLAQEHLLPPKVYSLSHGTDSLVPKAEWMVNNVDYQGKTNSTITHYVEMYTQFDVQKLPEHGNCYPQYIYLWY